MKTIIILMDSLNKRALDLYGGDWARTPNIDRLAQRCCVFDNHWVGSSPCMPARHDLMTGRLDFLERNWAPMQPFDCSLPQVLHQHGIFSEIITDHYHYFHLGGENYVPQFDSWEFIRGQEHDTMAPNLGAPVDKPHLGNFKPQYERNRARFQSEADYPSPKTFSQATKFLEEFHDEEFLLFVDTCDPHEPYDIPEGMERQYPDDYDGPQCNWPKYATGEQLPPDAQQHVRNLYAETVTMSDRWLGKFLDVMDKYNLWEDAAVFFIADHGTMVGEKNFFGKNYMPCYNETFQIPLMIHLPGMQTQTRCDALTQNIDLMPTILALYGIPESDVFNPMHGKNLLPLINGECDKVRDCVIYGLFGKHVNIFDGRYTYFRAPVNEDNMPLYLYTAMPSTSNHWWDRAHIRDVAKVQAGSFLKWTDYPVYRIPADLTVMADASHRFSPRPPYSELTMLFDLKTDPNQEHPLDDPALEKEMCRKLAREMRRYDSPDEQFVRLGLEAYQEA